MFWKRSAVADSLRIDPRAPCCIAAFRRSLPAPAVSARWCGRDEAWPPAPAGSRGSGRRSGRDRAAGRQDRGPSPAAAPARRWPAPPTTAKCGLGFEQTLQAFLKISLAIRRADPDDARVFHGCSTQTSAADRAPHADGDGTPRRTGSATAAVQIGARRARPKATGLPRKSCAK